MAKEITITAVKPIHSFFVVIEFLLNKLIIRFFNDLLRQIYIIIYKTTKRSFSKYEFILSLSNFWDLIIRTLFNKETEYALRGMVYIQVQNMKDRRPGIAEISTEIEAPHFFTAKILQRLVKMGFVNSAKGKGGGFYFDADKPELPLKDIIVATEGGKIFTGCGFGMKHCSESNPCPLHTQYATIRNEIAKLVTEETVQSLARKTLEGKGGSSYLGI